MNDGLNKNVKRIQQIAERIRTLRREHSNLLRIGAAYAKETGDLLLEAKPYLGRQWGKWLATEFDMTTECAYRYTTIATYWKRIENHERFPGLGVADMFDIARDRPLRKRSYKLIGCRLDTLLAILDERLVAIANDYPEIRDLIDAIDKARPAMEDAGLLKTDVEKRKRALRMQKAGAA